MNYREMKPEALRLIVEGAWRGIAPTYTHEQRFALAELERRAEEWTQAQKAAKSPKKKTAELPFPATTPSPETPE